MDSYMDFEAPFSSLFFVSPRLADSAAPAAFCCALDFAGMVVSLRLAPKIERSTYAFVPGSFYEDAGHRTKWEAPPSLLSSFGNTQLFAGARGRQRCRNAISPTGPSNREDSESRNRVTPRTRGTIGTDRAAWSERACPTV